MNSVIKGASYVLAHTPEMVVYNGTTQTTERVVNPESEYLKELRSHLRSYEECVNYWSNQVYIGNATPEELSKVEFPYYDKTREGSERWKISVKLCGRRVPLVQASRDMFQVVKLDKNFVCAHKDALAADPIITEDIISKIEEGYELDEIKHYIENEHAEGLYHNNELVGCAQNSSRYRRESFRPCNA